MSGVDYTQFKGRPFQVVSKLGVRYTGIFDHINQEDQTICLGEVFNHGTEDRPTTRKLPGSTKTLGWVRFHTESIESLALVENYLPPGEEKEEQVDPILASVSQEPPKTATPTAEPAETPTSTTTPSQPAQSQRHDLPARPPPSTSATTALERVRSSLSELSTNPTSNSNPNYNKSDRYRGPARPRAPEVPDAEFDFSKGTSAFEAIKAEEQVTSPSTQPGELDSDGDAKSPETVQNGEVGKKSTVYQGKKGFFDGLSGESSRIPRTEERDRNLDTFGEEGGDGVGHAYNPNYRGRGGYVQRGGYQRGGFGGEGQRGGYGGQGQRGGYGQGQRGGFNGNVQRTGLNGQNGFDNPRGSYAGGGRGFNRGRGGFQSQSTQN